MRWPSLVTSRKTLFIGLDIATTAIKLLALYYKEERPWIHAYGYQPLAPGVMHGHFVQDISGLAQTIQQALTDLGLWSRAGLDLEIIIALPDACTIRKMITVSDRLSDADLEELVHLELDKWSSGSIHDLCFDFQRLSVSPDAATNLKNILIVAARVQHVQDRVMALQSIGLRTKVVDIESFAIQRIFPSISQIAHEGVTLLLDINSPFLKIYFFKAQELIFLREEECEGLASPWHPKVRDPALHLYLESILLRIKRACHFFYAANPQCDDITHILLGGEGAQYTDLMAFIAQNMNKPIHLANPFLQMNVMQEIDVQHLYQESGLYLTACGLAKRVC